MFPTRAFHLLAALVVALAAVTTLAEESVPVPQCFRALDLTGCWNMSVQGDCDECVATWAAKRGAKYNCTDRDEMAYCDGPEPKPGPITAACRRTLILLCRIAHKAHWIKS